MTAVALTIAGSDPSGGAGLQADLKTFHQHGVYGMSVVTLLTVQNTRMVSDVRVQPPELVQAQLAAVLNDIKPRAGKAGALGSAAMIELVAAEAAQFTFPLVVDPVMRSKHGHALIDDDAAEVLRERLLPRAFLVTPNLHEAAALAGMEVRSLDELERAAEAIARLGPEHVLIKGGGRGAEAVDVLWSNGGVRQFAMPRVDTQNTHGTGCVFSAAITARLAHGDELPQAIDRAKRFVTRAIESNPRLGRGLGPVNLFAPAE